MARIKRRVFLKVAGGVTAASFVVPGCLPQRNWVVPVEQPDGTVPGKAFWFATTCGECPAGCGLIARNLDGRVRKVEGNPLHPVARGKTCARGQTAVQRLFNPDRIKTPLQLSGQRGSGQYRAITWDDALKQLADKLRGTGGGNVAFLTAPLRGHRRFVVERFMAGLSAPAPVVFDLFQTVEGRDAIRRANQEAFGRAEIPDYNIDNCDYLVTFGADIFGTFLSPVYYGNGFGQMRQGRPTRGYMVAFEPRMTQAGAAADEWVPILPGSEGQVALALAGIVAAVRGGAAPSPAVTPEQAAQASGVPGGAATLQRIGRDLAAAQAGLAIGGGVAAGQTNGSWNLWAINALNGALGAIGRPGGVRFGPASPLADVPAAGPAMPLAGVQQLGQQLSGGQVQVLLHYEANPVFELPGALRFGESLARVPFMVSFSSFIDETSAYADLILPDATPLEQWGDDVPEPSVGFATASIRQPTQVEWQNTRQLPDVLLTLVQQLGNGGLSGQLPFASFVDLLKNKWTPLQSGNRGSVRGAADLNAFWDQALRQGGWWDQGAAGTPVSGAGTAPPAVEPPQYDGGNDFPYYFVPFLSPAWGDGKGANLPHLQEMPDPMTSAAWGSWVELNPQTAQQLGVKDNDLVEVRSSQGSVTAPVVIMPSVRPDVVSMPFGQGHTSYGEYAKGRGVNVAALLAPLTESRTGQLAWAATRVSVRKTGQVGRVVRYIRNMEGARQLPDYPLVETVPIQRGGRG